MAYETEIIEYLEKLQNLYGADFKIPAGKATQLRELFDQAQNSEPVLQTSSDIQQPEKIDTLPAKVMEKTEAYTATSDETNSPVEPLDQFCSEIKECQKCSLGKSRKNFVFGAGSPNADLMLIGEAPGADEDLQGIPFVGKAGQLLTKIVEAIGLKREEVYIANILKCRPPQNRDPQPEEVAQCLPYLNRQIEIIKPKVILLLGRVAATTLLETQEPLKSLRGVLHQYQGIDVYVTYHPAALLRNAQWKKPTWEDFKLIRDIL